MERILYVLVPAVLAVAAAALWLQRSPRRAALSTLKVAIAGLKAPSLARTPTGGLAVPAGSQRASRERTGTRSVMDRVAAAVARLGRPLSPPGYLTNLQRRLTLAGRDRPGDADRFLAVRLVTLLLVVPAFLFILLRHLSGLYGLLAFVLAAAVLGLGPEALLNRAVSERQEKARHDLPALVELLMISVEAGLGFDQALARAVGPVPGPLSEEFSRYLGEVRMGADHKAALEAIDRRTDIDELRSFLMALVQAETFGISIGPILRAQADQVRVAQRLHLQERAQKAPVMMLFPLVFCVLPALFIVVIGPAAIEIYKTIIKVK
ncbi:MAG: type II secretion system F family protein [Acidimicrobiales bacterium]